MPINKNYLNKCICDTKNQIELVKNEYKKLNLPQYVIDLEVSSLYIKLDELNKRLKTLDDNKKDGIVITFHPPGLKSGEIQARTLSSVLGNMQALTDSIANAEYNPSSSNCGPVPNDILERNSLIIREVKAGSFKVRLDLPDLIEDQISFDDDSIEDKDTCVLDKLHLLLSSSNDEDTLLQSISDLGDRVLSKYTNFVKSLKDSNTPVEMDFINSRNEISTVNLGIVDIDKIFNNLNDKLKVTEKYTQVTGTLIGANVRTNKFEMYTDDNKRISGNISKNLNYKLELGKRYLADILETTTINTKTNKSKTSRILDNLSQI